VTARAGHHAITFQAAHLAIGSEAAALTDYFDTCRRKRNVIDYDNSSVATETEAAELVRKAAEFHALVEKVDCCNSCNLYPLVFRASATQVPIDPIGSELLRPLSIRRLPGTL
jgi:hypothetical protein